jgi:hypothetical protein
MGSADAVIPRDRFIDLVGRRVPRIGYGTMRLTGRGVFGPRVLVISFSRIGWADFTLVARRAVPFPF